MRFEEFICYQERAVAEEVVKDSKVTVHTLA